MKTVQITFTYLDNGQIALKIEETYKGFNEPFFTYKQKQNSLSEALEVCHQVLNPDETQEEI